MSETRNSILFAYDGSEFAAEAIQEAGRMLAPCTAYVLTVWQPVEAIAMGPVGVAGAEIEKTDDELARGARETAEEGAKLARAAEGALSRCRFGAVRSGRRSSRSPMITTQA